MYFGPPDAHVRVVYTLSDLTSCLPKKLIGKMEKLDGPEGVVQYKGIELFACRPAYQGEQRKFYVLAALSDDLPGWLRNLRCSVEATGIESGSIAGVEKAIFPQAEGPSCRRPPDYDLRVEVKSDTWAGFQRACKIIEQCSRGFSRVGD